MCEKCEQLIKIVGVSTSILDSNFSCFFKQVDRKNAQRMCCCSEI